MARFRPRRRSSSPVSTRRQNRLRRFRSLFPRFSPLARLRGMDVLGFFGGIRRRRRLNTTYGLPSLGRRFSLLEALEPRQMLAADVRFVSPNASATDESMTDNVPAVVINGTISSGEGAGTISFSLGGNATQGSDYTLTGNITVFPGTYNNVVVPLDGTDSPGIINDAVLTVIDDSDLEPDEVISLQLQTTAPALTQSSPFTYDYTILDNDDIFTATAGDDDIFLEDIGGGQMRITINGSSQTFPAPSGFDGLITIDGLGGDDVIEIDRSVFEGNDGVAGDPRSFDGQVRVLGGSGDDTIVVDTDSDGTLGIDLELRGEGDDVSGEDDGDRVVVPVTSGLNTVTPSANLGVHGRLVVSTDPSNPTNNGSIVVLSSVTVDDSADPDATVVGSGDNQEAVLIAGSFNTLRLMDTTIISDSDDMIRVDDDEPDVDVRSRDNRFIFVSNNNNGEVNGRAFIRYAVDLGRILLIDLEDNEPATNGLLQARTPEDTPITLDVRSDRRNVASVSATNGFAQINSDGTITFTPNINFFGEAIVTYTLDDPQNVNDNGVVGDATGQVRILVGPQDTAGTNDPPVNSLPSQYGPIPENGANNAPTMIVLSGFPLGVTDVDAVDSTDPIEVTFSVAFGTLMVDTTGHAGVTIVSPTPSGNTASGQTVVLRGTEAALNPFLQDNGSTPGLKYMTDAVHSGDIQLTMTSNDLGANGTGGAQTDTDTAIIRVTAINDAPVNELNGSPISSSNKTITGFTEGPDDQPVPGLSVDDDAFEGNKTIKVTLTVPNGTLEVNADADNNTPFTNSTAIMGNGTGGNPLMITGAISDVNQILTTLTWTPDNDFNGTANLVMTTEDFGNSGEPGAPSLTDTDEVMLVVSGENDPPVNLWNGTSFDDLGGDDEPDLNIMEDMAFRFNSANNARITVRDIDASTSSGSDPIMVTLRLINQGLNPPHGSLDFASNPSGLSSVSGRGTMTLTFKGTVSEVNAALDLLTFTPGLNQTTPLKLEIETSDQGSSGSGGVGVDTDAIDINITPKNDEPVINVQAPDTQTLLEDTDVTFNAANSNMITITDVDGDNLSVTLQVEGGSSVGILDVSPSGANISGDQTSTVTILGTESQVNQALNGMRFEPADNYYGPANIKITANDLGNSPPPATESMETILLAVNPVNDEPVNRLNGQDIDSLPVSHSENLDRTVSVAEDGMFTFTGTSQISITDIDANAPEASGSNARLVKVTLDVDHGTLMLPSTVGLNDPDDDDSIAFNNASTIQFEGTLASVNAALDGLKYTPNQDFQGQDTLEILTDDQGNFGLGGAQADLDTLIINVGGDNDPPSFDIQGTVVVMEDSGFHDIDDFLTNLSPGPNESGQNVTVEIDESNSGLFSSVPVLTTGSNGSSRDLEFTLAPDAYGSSVVTITAEDDGGTPSDPDDDLSFSRNFLIIVSPKNDRPVVTLPPAETIMEEGMLLLSADDGTTQNPRTPNQIIVDDDSGDAANPGNIDVRLRLVTDWDPSVPSSERNPGTLSLQSSANLNVQVLDGGRTLLITGTQPAIQAALDAGVKYTAAPNFNSTRGDLELEVAVDDFGREGGPDFDTATSSNPDARFDEVERLPITVTAKNDPVTTLGPDPFPNIERPEDAPPENIFLGLDRILGSNFFNDADKFDVPPDSISVTATSSIADGSSSNIVSAQVVGANLVLTFRQDASGTETVTVTAQDMAGTTASDSFLVTVGGVNDDPIITHNDQIPSDNNNDTTRDLGNDDVTPEDTLLRFDATTIGPGQITVDNRIVITDADDSILTVTLQVQNGTLTLNTVSGLSFSSGDGTSDSAMSFTGSQASIQAALTGMTYLPNQDFNGVDPLFITATDGTATRSLTVELNVDPVNDRPIANPDSFTFMEDSGPQQLNVLINDTAGPSNETQGLRIIGLSDAAPNTPGFQTAQGGTIAIGPTPSQGLHVVYTPAQTDSRGRIIGLAAADQHLFDVPPGGFHGQDSFQYQIRDDQGADSVLQNVTVNVTPKNDAPIVDVRPDNNPFPPTSSSNPDPIESSRTISMPEDTMQALSDLVFINDDANGDIQVTFNATRGGSRIFVDGTSTAVGDLGGIQVFNNNSNAVTVIGTPEAIQAALADSDSKYTPEADFNENVGNGQEQLVIRAEDFGQEGGGASLVSTGTITFEIDAVDDLPTIHFIPNPVEVEQNAGNDIMFNNFAGDPDPGNEGANPRRDPGGPDEHANEDVNIISVTEMGDNPSTPIGDSDNVISLDFIGSDFGIRNSDGKLQFDVIPNVVGSEVIQVVVQETGGQQNTLYFRINVGINKEPLFDLVGNVPGNLTDGDPNNNGNIKVNEDTDFNFFPDFVRNMFAGPSNDFPDVQSIQSVAVSVISGLNLFTIDGQPRIVDLQQPTGTGLQGGGSPGSADLTFTLRDDVSGTATVQVIVTDNGGTQNGGDDTAVKTFTIEIMDTNDPPSFTIPSTAPPSLEDAGPQTVNNFATNISPGAGDGGQTVSFVVTPQSGNPAGLFSSAPSISPSGTLTYQAAPNANGVAFFNVQAVDSGGATSGTQSFAILVNPVNDEPSASFNPNPVVVAEDSGPQTILGHTVVSPGPSNESGQIVTLSILGNDNTGLFSSQPTLVNAGGNTYNLQFQPAAGASGVANVTILLTDDGGTSNGGDNTATATFQIAVTSDADAVVEDRHIFYKNSAYDPSLNVLNSLDGSAIDFSKDALLPNNTATFANMTGYSRGINGIMIDVTDLANPNAAALADDLSFRTGNSNDTSTWTPLNPALVESIFVHALDADTHRISIGFVDGAITDTWLEVRLDASSDTGLDSQDVHYWGNVAGNTGNDTFPGVADVAAGDLQGIAQNIDPFPNSLVTNRFDLNKDRRRDGGDLQVISQNVNPFALFYITPNGALGSASAAAIDVSAGDESGTEGAGELGGEVFSGGNTAAEDGRVGETSEDSSIDDAFASLDQESGSVDDDLLDLLAGGLAGDDLMS